MGSLGDVSVNAALNDHHIASGLNAAATTRLRTFRMVMTDMAQREHHIARGNDSPPLNLGSRSVVPADGAFDERHIAHGIDSPTGSPASYSAVFADDALGERHIAPRKYSTPPGGISIDRSSRCVRAVSTDSALGERHIAPGKYSATMATTFRGRIPTDGAVGECYVAQA